MQTRFPCKPGDRVADLRPRARALGIYKWYNLRKEELCHEIYRRKAEKPPQPVPSKRRPRVSEPPPLISPFEHVPVEIVDKNIRDLLQEGAARDVLALCKTNVRARSICLRETPSSEFPALSDFAARFAKPPALPEYMTLLNIARTMVRINEWVARMDAVRCEMAGLAIQVERGAGDPQRPFAFKRFNYETATPFVLANETLAVLAHGGESAEKIESTAAPPSWFLVLDGYRSPESKPSEARWTPLGLPLSPEERFPDVSSSMGLEDVESIWDATERALTPEFRDTVEHAVAERMKQSLTQKGVICDLRPERMRTIPGLALAVHLFHDSQKGAFVWTPYATFSLPTFSPSPPS